MVENNFCEKYMPKILDNLPVDKEFTSLIETFINIDSLKIILLSEDEFMKTTIVNSIIKRVNVNEKDILFVNKIKDQGVTNIRYETKLFCQSPSIKDKKILIIDDIHLFNDTIQKIFINNIDKWSNNVNVIITTNNIYCVDEILVTRMFPMHVPPIKDEQLFTIIDNVCMHENIDISTKIKKQIIIQSDHNLQNIYHILEKCKLIQMSKPITLALISDMSTLIHVNDFKKYIEIIKEHNVTSAYKHLLKITENGHSVLDILNEFYYFIKITDFLSEEEKYKFCRIIRITFIYSRCHKNILIFYYII